MTSIRKIEANRQNARKNSGAKTQAAKNNSSRNSLKHGFFACELVLSDADKATLEALRRTLYAQLVPKTPLQQIACEEIVCCCWRCKLAARLEMRRLNALLSTTQNQESGTDDSEAMPELKKWYGSGRQALNDGFRFLRRLKEDVERNGCVREPWKDGIIRGFGIELWELFAIWKPMSIDALQLAYHFDEHRKKYGPFPDTINSKEAVEPKETVPADHSTPKQVVPDPEQSLQMTLKLIELQAQHLQDLRRAIDGGIFDTPVTSSGPVDFAPRYYTTATRDFHRAVEWYRGLKKNKL